MSWQMRSNHSDMCDCMCKDSSYLESDDFNAAPIEETTFLDSLNNTLEKLKEQCARAIQWSDESSEIFDYTFDGFKKVMDICEDAGLPVTFEDSPMIQDVPSRSSLSNSFVFPASTSSSAGDSTYNRFDRLTIPVTHMPSHRSHTTTQSKQEVPRKSKEVYNSRIYESKGLDDSRMNNFWMEKYFENERSQVAIAQRQEKRIQSLEETLKNSIATTLSVQKELEQQNRKLHNFQESFGQSQKMVQHVMSEQVNYWKNMCDDLSYEKRNMAKQLAIQRGKNTALKEHIALLLGNSSESFEIDQQENDDIFFGERSPSRRRKRPVSKSQHHRTRSKSPRSSQRLSPHKSKEHRKKQYNSDPESDSSLTSDENSKEYVIFQEPPQARPSQAKGSETTKSSAEDVASIASSGMQKEVLQSNFRRFYLSSSRGKTKM